MADDVVPASEAAAVAAADASSSSRSDALESRVAALVQQLKDDAVFAASLGSKELFHSNLLGWYLEHSPSLADSLLTAWTGRSADGGVRVRREAKHLDLVIEDSQGQALLVVENKTFSLPDDRQLAGYGPVIGKLSGAPSAVLLSVAPPAWPGSRRLLGEHEWQYRSYEELRLLLVPCVSDLAALDGGLLAGWTRLLGRLQELLDLVGQPGPHERVVLPVRVRELLRQVRLDGPVQKLRAQTVASLVRQQLGDQPDADRVRVTANLTNGTGLVDGYRAYDAHTLIGWQRRIQAVGASRCF